MIPEESFNFNGFRTSSNFDHPEVRWPHLLQQDALSAMEAGRHLLLVCPVCKQPWFKAGRQEYPRLTPVQLAFLGAALQVDIHAFYLLPRALCTICSALHLGGIFSAQMYSHDGGYRFLWESVSPRRIQLLAMVYRGKSISLDALLLMTPETIAEPTGEVRSMLAWLETCPTHDTNQAFTDEQSQHLAWCWPLGNAVDESLCKWRGYAWETICPLLGGSVIVLLAVAAQSSSFPLFDSLRLGWRVLARAMRAVL